MSAASFFGFSSRGVFLYSELPISSAMRFSVCANAAGGNSDKIIATTTRTHIVSVPRRPTQEYIRSAWCGQA
jgi:hypothetical protein